MPAHLPLTIRMIGFLAFLLALLAFPASGLRAAPPGNGSAGPPILEWSIDADVIVPGSEAAKGVSPTARTERFDELVGKLNSYGARAETRVVGTDEKGITYNLKASGKGDPGSFRNLIYTVLKPQFSLLGSATEMEISGPISGPGDVTIVLETNPSSGHRWYVAPDSAMTARAPSRYERHTTGYGASQRQTIRLTQGNSGAGPIKLVYGRTWEGSKVSQRVKVSASSIPSELDLSNPNAPVGPAHAMEGVTYDEAFPSVAQADLPSHFDWRDNEGTNIVTPIRDQGYGGSCWAFGTVGIMESTLWKNGVADQDLSEQFLCNCNTKGWSCAPDGGGWTAHMFHYNKRGTSQTTVGAVLETDLPYVYSGRDDSCTTNYDKPYVLTGWKFITGSENTMPTVDQLKSAIYTYGPITAGVCVGSKFQDYTDGIFSDDEHTECCDPMQNPCTNHQIIIVGWDDPGQYWILRNSWGKEWGIDGYMHIKYATSRVGEGTSWVTTGSGKCSYTIASANPAQLNHRSGSGATVRIAATGGRDCMRPIVTPGAAWLTYSHPTFHGATGTVRITATSENQSSIARTLSVTIGDATLNITQQGTPCTIGAFDPPKASFDNSAHTENTFAVSVTPSDCEWNVAADEKSSTWIVNASKTIPGTGVTYDVQANQGTRNRTGKIKVSIVSKPAVNRVFTVTQTD
jgi:C1A family cysteine protease